MKMDNFFCTEVRQQMMCFLKVLIPKIRIPFFCEFGDQVTSGARGFVSVGFWGARQLRRFLRGGSARPVGSIDAPPPFPSSPPPPRSRKPAFL